jgi:hypothetical protein
MIRNRGKRIRKRKDEQKSNTISRYGAECTYRLGMSLEESRMA